MEFVETKVQGAYLVKLNKMGDDRGFFARAYCEQEFQKHGLRTPMVQANTSLCQDKGTLRGLHYQVAPDLEAKYIRCIRGAIFDVVLDLRVNSPTYKRWFGVELSCNNRDAVYVPEGCAHGFQALTDDTEVFYLVSNGYSPKSERGVRWNDPAFNIDWPITNDVILSAKDEQWPDFSQ